MPTRVPLGKLDAMQGARSAFRKKSAVLVAWLLLAACANNQSPQVDRLVAPGQEATLRPAVAKSDRKAVRDLFVFGDSLSDTGRLKAHTLGFYLPSEVYWQGRASNGPVWLDYLCGALDCKPHNYAVAGAATSAAAFPVSLVVPSLAEEIDSFFAEDPPFDPATAMALVWIGANNYLASPQPPDGARRDIQAAARRLLNSPVTRLAIGTMPDLSGILKAPNSRKQSADTLQRSSVDHNRMIHTLIADLRRQFPKKQVILFDAYTVNQATIEQPLAYGFTELGQACYQGDYSGHFFGKSSFCADFYGVKLWDYIHPNSRMHCHYATRLLADLTTAGVIHQFRPDAARSLCNTMTGGKG